MTYLISPTLTLATIRQAIFLVSMPFLILKLLLVRNRLLFPIIEPPIKALRVLISDE